jgi:para-aminobenzoate synthetase component I
MKPFVEPVETHHTADSLVTSLRDQPGVVLLRGASPDGLPGRVTLVTARPYLRFRSWGSRCEITSATGSHRVFGNPWRQLEGLMARYELLDQIDLPFPLGGCFGVWGYGLRRFLEPRLARGRALTDLELPDADLGFYHSLVVFDHAASRAWVIATGLQPDGSRTEAAACTQALFWCDRLESNPAGSPAGSPPVAPCSAQAPVSTLSRAAFITAVEQAQAFIRAGHIYQVNLAHRLSASWGADAWEFHRQLNTRSPAPLAAWMDAGDYQLASSSPELFLRLSGAHVCTRPIKGTRPRHPDPTRDAQLAYELQTSPKETAELVMITDLLRNDLGRVCEYGTVTVSDLLRLERYAHVQHLVSTVEGRLRPSVTHDQALAACFPGGSITGAPKFRAMEIIDELEPVSRGPYTGALGYLGFNRESQLAIVIRSALIHRGRIHFHVGAGIVADSDPAAEYEETLAKARGFLEVLQVMQGSRLTGAVAGAADPLAPVPRLSSS